MASISIRELHMHTGKWVRRAAVAGEPLIVMDRGRPAARLMPLEDLPARSFASRRVLPGFADLPEIVADSGGLLEEDRR